MRCADPIKVKHTKKKCVRQLRFWNLCARSDNSGLALLQPPLLQLSANLRHAQMIFTRVPVQGYQKESFLAPFTIPVCCCNLLGKEKSLLNLKPFLNYPSAFYLDEILTYQCNAWNKFDQRGLAWQRGQVTSLFLRSLLEVFEKRIPYEFCRLSSVSPSLEIFLRSGSLWHISTRLLTFCISA